MISIFYALLGEWSIQRAIHSFQGDFLGTFSGKALYKAISPQLLHYREEGMFYREQSRLCTFKDYYFLYNEGIKIYFDLELTRLFYAMEFQSQDAYPFQAGGMHYCGEDTYQMHYIFNSKEEHTITVSVNGPRKNYVITSNSFLDFKGRRSLVNTKV